jgi:hypothetical protein
VADPAAVAGTDDEKLRAFRWARDLLREWTAEWLENLQPPSQRRRRVLQAAGLVVLAVAASGIAWWRVDGPTAVVIAAVGVVVALTWFLWRQ